ncbi:Cytochrome P450 4c3, partial [Pseudolycoriella hygida]
MQKGNSNVRGTVVLVLRYIRTMIVGLKSRAQAYSRRRSRMVKLINKIPGPPALPFIGNTVECNVDHDEIFARITALRSLWGRRQGICKAWFGLLPYVFVSDAAKVETIMGSPKHIDKSRDYDFLHPWLGTGLLTSHGKKWHSRRK